MFLAELTRLGFTAPYEGEAGGFRIYSEARLLPLGPSPLASVAAPATGR